MKFNKKLTSPEKAKQFIFDLKNNNLDFHLEDDIILTLDTVFSYQVLETFVKSLEPELLY